MTARRPLTSRRIDAAQLLDRIVKDLNDAANFIDTLPPAGRLGVQQVIDLEDLRAMCVKLAGAITYHLEGGGEP